MKSMKDEQIERIRDMEERMNRYASALRQLEEALELVTREQDTYKQLRDYYMDPSYMKDVAFSNDADFPSGVACGVLSEDLLYNLLDDHTNLAVEMIDLASQMLKHR